MTTKDKPYRFWLNDDFDVVWNDGNADLSATICPPASLGVEAVCEAWDDLDTNATNSDSSNIGNIESARDLEDFAPLALMLNVGASSKDANGNISLPDGVSMSLTAHGFGINLFTAEWDKGLEYIHDFTTGQNQAEESEMRYLFELKPGETFTLQPEHITKMFGQENVAKLIFEGTKKSQMSCVTDSTNCYLEYSLHSGGAVINKEKLYMNILPIKHYYDHYTAGKGINGGLAGGETKFNPGPVSATTNLHNSENIGYVDIFAHDTDDDEYKDYIMFVHGWRMQFPERVSFAETAFKRLYWTGNQNRFGAFTWPTGWFKKPANEYSTAIVAFRLQGNEQNYGNSEAFARIAGFSLYNTLLALKSNSDIDGVRVFAHSMGNVVVSEALRNANQTLLVDTYVALNAATVGSAYFPKQPFIRHTVIPPLITEVKSRG